MHNHTPNFHKHVQCYIASHPPTHTHTYPHTRAHTHTNINMHCHSSNFTHTNINMHSHTHLSLTHMLNATLHHTHMYPLHSATPNSSFVWFQLLSKPVDSRWVRTGVQITVVQNTDVKKQWFKALVDQCKIETTCLLIVLTWLSRDCTIFVELGFLSRNLTKSRVGTYYCGHSRRP